MFHKIGISKDQAEQLVAFNNRNTLSALQDKKNQDEADLQIATDALNLEWGNAKDQRIHFGNVAVDKAVAGDEEFRIALSNAIGTSPTLTKAFSNLGAMFTEHGDVSAKNIPTPGDLQDQIDEVLNSKVYLGGAEISDKLHQDAVNKLQRLFEERNKSAG